MIKWFDADKFLPGHDAGDVLIRYRQSKEEVIGYDIGSYGESKWISIACEEIENDKTAVTHWAHINEPFE